MVDRSHGPHAEDVRLVRRWAQGDREAGNTLLTTHIGVVHRFFRNKVDTALADLVQETFAACTTSRERYDGRSSFRAYLLGIANNLLLMHFRGLQQHARVFAAGSVPSVAAVMTSPSQVVTRDAEQRLVVQALRTLALDQQTLLELYYWEELSLAEIGRIVQAPVGTLKSRLARGRAELRGVITRLRGVTTRKASGQSQL